MPLKVFYNSNQSVAVNASFSPSAGKPALIADLFSKNPKVQIESNFLPLTRDEIKSAHDPSFVDDVLDCKRKNGFNNTLQTVADSLPWTNGSFFAAAKEALVNKTVTMSPTSGFHHAEYSSPEGFCTFNGLMITALMLKKQYNVKHISIIDFDAHYGNGADQIIKKFGIDWITNYTFGYFADDILKSSGPLGFDAWLTTLEDFKLETIVSNSDIILYQAGADPHEEDPYGGFLSTEQMRRRDEIVFRVSNKLNIPIVWNLAGGYQSPVEKVLQLHVNSLDECIKAYGL